MTLLVFVSMLACTPRSPGSGAGPGADGAAGNEANPVIVDPDALYARASAEPAPAPQLATFSVRLQTPKDQLSAQGSLVIAPPSRFRVELRGPIGPAALVVVCDGQTLVAWNTMKGQAWRSPDAEAALRTMTGNAAGVPAVVSLLLGRLPAIGAPAWTGEMWRWDGPAGEIVTARLEPARGRLTTVQAADAAGALLLSARYTAGEFPSALALRLPALGASADVSFSSWQTVAPPDSTFSLTLPEHVAVAPMPAPSPPEPQ